MCSRPRTHYSLLSRLDFTRQTNQLIHHPHFTTVGVPFGHAGGLWQPPYPPLRWSWYCSLHAWREPTRNESVRDEGERWKNHQPAKLLKRFSMFRAPVVYHFLCSHTPTNQILEIRVSREPAGGFREPFTPFAKIIFFLTPAGGLHSPPWYSCLDQRGGQVV